MSVYVYVYIYTGCEAKNINFWIGPGEVKKYFLRANIEVHGPSVHGETSFKATGHRVSVITDSEIDF